MNQTIDTQDNPPESMSINATILVVEDEPAIGRLLHSAVTDGEYQLNGASTASEALDALAEAKHDIAIVDLSLSKEDPVDIVERIRRSDSLPILIAYTSGQESERIDALFAGADDYVAKPIRLHELQACMNNAVRRKQMNAALGDKSVFECDRLKLDFSRKKMYLSGKEIHLTPTEFKLLSVLVENVGRIVTHRQLLTEVWGKEYLDEVQYLRIYMGHLRKKLGEYSNNKKLLLTEPRIGYRFSL